jgi:hypothetical protein
MAEHAEKTIRSSLEGRIPREQLSQVVFMVEYLPDASGSVTYRLIVSSRESGTLRTAASQQALTRQVEEQFQVFVRSEASGGARAGGVEYVSPARSAPTRAPEGGKLWPALDWGRPLKSAYFKKKMPVAAQSLYR